MSSFDDLLRQGQQLNAQGDRKRESAAAEDRTEKSALEEWRQTLRDFGLWFASEASAKGVPTVPLTTETKDDRPVVPPKRTLMQRLNGDHPRTPPRPPRVEVRRGWAILPLDPGTGKARPGTALRYGGSMYFDAYVNSKDAYLCLAVDVDGRVQVGAQTEAGVALTLESDSLFVDLVGMSVDELTPRVLLSSVAQMSYQLPIHFQSVDLYPDRILEASRANDELSAAVLSFYVAQAQRMLA